MRPRTGLSVALVGLVIAVLCTALLLLLRLFEELPAEEVATRMDRTPGAVRMLQMRALSALKEQMEKVGPRSS